MSSSSPSADPPRSPDGWPAQAADSIERFVTKVRDATTGKAITAARAVVYGLLALILAIMVLVLAINTVVRLLVSYLPGERVWLAHLISGVFFVIVGAIAWKFRRTKPEVAR